MASIEDREAWNIETFLEERMGRPVEVRIKRPCVHKFIWLGTKFGIAAFAMIYSRGIEGELEAVTVPFSAVGTDSKLLDELSKVELEKFRGGRTGFR